MLSDNTPKTVVVLYVNAIDIQNHHAALKSVDVTVPVKVQPEKCLETRETLSIRMDSTGTPGGTTREDWADALPGERPRKQPQAFI